MNSGLQGHLPVMLTECMDLLKASAGGTFIDATFGGGGHTRALLAANPNNQVWGIDQDPAAATRAHALAQETDHFHFIQANFSHIAHFELPLVNGILMDLGVSSFQLDESERGFSFKYHTPLDMRMNNHEGITAYEFLKSASLNDLEVAIRDYGEERYYKKIIQTILDHRKDDVLKFGDTFARLIAENIPVNPHSKIHPATKTFQGIRIFINDELRVLEKTLPLMFQQLSCHGRFVIITFHSLEDRIVKRYFNAICGKPVDRYDSTPQQERVAHAMSVLKKPLSPTEQEISMNPRSRSAKIRVIEKFQSLNL